MTCSACSNHVEKAVGKLDGVKSVTVHLLQNTMTVEYDDNVLNDSEIVDAVKKAGYGAFVAGGNKTSNPESEKNDAAAIESQQMKTRLIWSIIFLMPLGYIAMGPMVGLPLPSFLSGHENAIAYGMAQLLLTLSIAYLNRNYFQNGFQSLLNRAPTMDALIAIGSSAAIIYGIYAIVQMGYGLAIQDFMLVEKYHMDMYFESAGTILTLITVGKYLEKRSKSKTSDAITKLMNLTPKTALVERNGLELEISVDDVVVGDILIVKSGNTIPVDGTVIEGFAAVDESAITGESVPVEKTTGDFVTCATINNSGFIKIKAIRVGEETTLARIIQLVEEAGAGKAPISKLADRISAVFVPAVIFISILATAAWLLLGYPFEFALSIGIAVLVISCPCALGLATPTAIMVGTGKGAESGILFKSAESIETAHTVKTVILDKTGTVTEGKTRVVEIYPKSGIRKEELISYAASVEKMSEHPLAAAIIEKAESMRVDFFSASDFRQIPGQGVYARIGGEEVYAGNAKMMAANHVDIETFADISDSIAYNGQTPLYFAKEKRLLGIIAIADSIKPSSKQAISEFKKMGMDVILLTGDNERTAGAIARQLEIDRVIAGVLPQEKEAEIRKQQEQGKKVAMIGDGINDAPALTRADVGIAIGAGTDIAIESADVVLMKNDLADAVTAFKLSKATIKNIKQNLFWAFFYNILGIPLAAGVFYSMLGWKLSPIFAAAAMSLSSLFVVTNALRLRFFKIYEIETTPKACPIDFSESEKAEAKDEQKRKSNENQSPKQSNFVMKIEGMTCHNCKKHVEKTLTDLPNVFAVVDLETGTADVKTDEKTDAETLKQTVEKEGYAVVSIQRV